MVTDKKFTKGELVYKKLKQDGYGMISIHQNGWSLCDDNEFTSIAGIWSTNEVDFANAKLIVDAGNTANRCGLFPSEILEQRDELLEQLRSIIDGTAFDNDSGLIWEHRRNEIETVIKKITS